MSAVVIYPAAFQRSGSENERNVQSIYGGNAVAHHDMSRPTVSLLADMRQATEASSERLSVARREIAVMRSQEDELANHAGQIEKTSQDLGAQMERLIEETRRMVAYLRAE